MSTMTADEIEAVLTAVEAEITASGTADLRGAGFWRAVAGVKRDQELTDRFAGRVGAIDQTVFREWAPITISMAIGTTLALAATVLGLGLIGAAYYAEEPAASLLFLAGTAVLLGATHGLGHIVVGRLVGIRFTVWFAGYRRPQPGVKTDYASYLRTPARARAWMHASGAIVTKAIPFLLIPSAFIAGISPWAIVVLVVLAVGQVITDVAWSTKSSDWAKFRREMRYAR